MGQAKNRGTREQRIAQAVSRWRSEPPIRGTTTGRISGRETHFKELPRVDKVPRVEVSPMQHGDFSALEERILEPRRAINTVVNQIIVVALLAATLR